MPSGKHGNVSEDKLRPVLSMNFRKFMQVVVRIQLGPHCHETCAGPNTAEIQPTLFGCGSSLVVELPSGFLENVGTSRQGLPSGGVWP